MFNKVEQYRENRILVSKMVALNFPTSSRYHPDKLKARDTSRSSGARTNPRTTSAGGFYNANDIEQNYYCGTVNLN